MARRRRELEPEPTSDRLDYLRAGLLMAERLMEVSGDGAWGRAWQQQKVERYREQIAEEEARLGRA